jgi:hypothetical protein
MVARALAAAALAVLALVVAADALRASPDADDAARRAAVPTSDTFPVPESAPGRRAQLLNLVDVVDKLVSMGYPRDKVEQALRENQGDEDLAADQLARLYNPNNEVLPCVVKGACFDPERDKARAMERLKPRVLVDEPRFRQTLQPVPRVRMPWDSDETAFEAPALALLQTEAQERVAASETRRAMVRARVASREEMRRLITAASEPIVFDENYPFHDCAGAGDPPVREWQASFDDDEPRYPFTVDHNDAAFVELGATLAASMRDAPKRFVPEPLFGPDALGQIRLRPVLYPPLHKSHPLDPMQIFKRGTGRYRVAGATTPTKPAPNADAGKAAGADGANPTAPLEPQAKPPTQRQGINVQPAQQVAPRPHVDQSLTLKDEDPFVVEMKRRIACEQLDWKLGPPDWLRERIAISAQRKRQDTASPSLPNSDQAARIPGSGARRQSEESGEESSADNDPEQLRVVNNEAWPSIVPVKMKRTGDVITEDWVRPVQYDGTSLVAPLGAPAPAAAPAAPAAESAASSAPAGL